MIDLKPFVNWQSCRPLFRWSHKGIWLDTCLSLSIKINSRNGIHFFVQREDDFVVSIVKENEEIKQQLEFEKGISYQYKVQYNSLISNNDLLIYDKNYLGYYIYSWIKSASINNYTQQLLNEGLLPKTVKDILIILQQILKTVDIKLEIAMPKVPKKEIQIFTKE